MTNEDKNSATSILQSAASGTIKDCIHILPGQGNILGIELSDRVILVDCGHGGSQTAKLLSKLREVTAHANTVDFQQALHVIDLVVTGPDEHAAVHTARQLKADWCRERANEIRPNASKALYHSSAELLQSNRDWRAHAS